MLIDPRNNNPFYVGKGYGTRMYAHKTEATKKPSKTWYNVTKCRIILSILKSGEDIKYHYVLCETEQQALKLEEEWIRQYGRLIDETGCLANISPAGEVANPICKPIDVYDIAGNYIATYKSSNEAAREMLISDPGIVLRCLHNYDALQTYKGHVFVYQGHPFNYKDNKIKIVLADNGVEVLTFNGTKAAGKFFDRSTSCIRQSCTNNWSIKGYRLSYK